ncbi:MAG: biotin-dependent carboxyltransferase family protein [Bacteroidota bacterium]
MIRILKSGIQTTVQETRREGFLSLGFPASGPMDSLSMMGANYLTGGAPYAAALEMYIQGPSIQFEQPCAIAICGADMSPKVNGKPVLQNALIEVSKGDHLEFEPAKNGLIAYLAFNASLKVSPYLFSKSTYLAGSLGGYKGRSLIKGDTIEFEEQKSVKHLELPNVFRYIQQNELYLRIVKGPEFELFEKKDQESFLNNGYKISNDSNRMGIRLLGDSPKEIAKSDIISSAVLPGTIQIPKNGNPIIMMHDHQTTGGYCRIGNVITHDLDFLSQALPASDVSFRLISNTKSVELLKKRINLVNRLFAKRNIS